MFFLIWKLSSQICVQDLDNSKKKSTTFTNLDEEIEKEEENKKNNDLAEFENDLTEQELMTVIILIGNYFRVLRIYMEFGYLKNFALL